MIRRFRLLLILPVILIGFAVIALPGMSTKVLHARAADGSWSCNNGTVTSEDLPNLSQAAQDLGLSFDPNDPCSFIDGNPTLSATADFANQTVAEDQSLPVLVAGPIPNEQCYERTKSVDVKSNVGNTLAVIKAGFNYCTDGNMVYGRSGNASTEPGFIGTVTGQNYTALIQITCGGSTNGALSITGKGWLSYKGNNSGAYFTNATSLCEVSVFGKNSPIKISSFTVNFTSEVYADAGVTAYELK